MHSEKVAVVGASGYSGEELIRLLIRHPFADVVALTSRQYAGQRLDVVYPKFSRQRYAELPFIASDAQAIAAAGATSVFLALPHGVASDFAKPLLDAGLRVLDLSADFRLKDAASYEEFYGEKHRAPELAKQSVYGLPEVYRDQIRKAALVACPGCYPTGAILPLVPLLRERLLDPATIVITSLSGVSGAGRNAKVDYLFAECNESARAYGAPRHRHLPEIEQELSAAYGSAVRVSFTPHLIPVTRGLLTTIHASPARGLKAEQISRAFEESYGKEPFIRLLADGSFADTKHVTHTNFLDLAWRFDARTQRLILLSAEDNLVKGAAGQAVQCLNVMYGWPETTGLL